MCYGKGTGQQVGQREERTYDREEKRHYIPRIYLSPTPLQFPPCCDQLVHTPGPYIPQAIPQTLRMSPVSQYILLDNPMFSSDVGWDIDLSLPYQDWKCA